MQIKSMFNTDTISLLPNFNLVKSYVDIDVDNLLDSIGYVQNNIENSDHYYFSTDTNKNNFFDLTEYSYSYVMNDYQSALDLLVEISEWYRSIVIGG